MHPTPIPEFPPILRLGKAVELLARYGINYSENGASKFLSRHLEKIHLPGGRYSYWRRDDVLDLIHGRPVAKSKAS